MSRREVRALLASAEKQGFTVTRRRNGHLKLTKGEHVIFTSSTPSDPRAWKNIRAHLRRAGYED